eukprot:TRINITY_DN3244_c2_g2_i2.p1 TRINITY_DN3244_c2_g2~~TRINITY_DN3244_c2_g2_i2.p1  ORF type:complete len:544 (+),score=43.31 TRINITY_DN3244_c2_g2_i2:45-1634(+)
MQKSGVSGLLARLTFAVLFVSLKCAVHTYYNQYFVAVGEHAYLFRGGREGLYRSKNVDPADLMQEMLYDEFYYDYNMLGAQFLMSGVATGESFVKYEELTFKRPRLIAEKFKNKEYEITGTIQLVLFELEDINNIGLKTSSGQFYCCTEELKKETSNECTPGRLIYRKRDSDPTWPLVQDLDFIGNKTEARLANHDGAIITKTGMYYLWFVACGQDLASLQVSGHTVWKNPFGYLPGMMSPNLKFFGLMALAYLILALVWMVLCFVNWRDLITLQHCISLVIAMDMMEMSTWYFDYVTFNHSGFRPEGTTLWAVILGCIRKTFSRVLVLLVAMGYGTVRPTLGGLSKRVIAVGIAYLAAILVYDLYFNVGQIDDLEGWMRILLVLPASLLDAVFILWIFTALSRTLTQLQKKNQGVKLMLYRRFTNALAITVWIAVLWLVYELWFRFSDPDNEKWRYEWLCNAFWYMLNFGFLVLICLLWAPSTNATRYAYQEAEGDLFLEQVKQAQPQTNTDVFTIDFEDETVSAKKE